MFDLSSITYPQLVILRSRANADQALMKSMATCICRHAFNTMNNLTHTNVIECATELRKAGVDASVDDLEDAVAHNFAERFATTWPELDERVKYLSSFYAGVARCEAERLAREAASPTPSAQVLP